MKAFTKETYMYILGALVVSCAATAVTLLIFHAVPPDNKDIVNIALGSLLTMAATIVNYFFGSSKSSADKTELLSQQQPPVI